MELSAPFIFLDRPDFLPFSLNRAKTFRKLPWNRKCEQFKNSFSAFWYVGDGVEGKCVCRKPVLPMYLTIPVTSVTSERTFSALIRLKNYLRITMKQDRLNNYRLWVVPSRLSRVGWFSRALAFRLLYNPWEKMGTTRSLEQLLTVLGSWQIDYENTRHYEGCLC